MTEQSTGLSIPLPSDRRLYWGLFLNSQLLALAAYVFLTPASFDSFRLIGYGLVWLNVSAWVVTNTPRPTASRAL
ncbi:MAG: DUF7546 family protein, partial [Halohasta sp.]